jgi:hypothetical protein
VSEAAEREAVERGAREATEKEAAERGAREGRGKREKEGAKLHSISFTYLHKCLDKRNAHWLNQSGFEQKYVNKEIHFSSCTLSPYEIAF